ncbi:polysaccharide deacetylase family protein [Namhaeicola litoreus]|uniref:Polysaccharide deacetylase family protein n=1 Tax=Namhaeicola litoreus TaxID=1052145 RepID=A0ABW3XZ06_9FLAO
MKRKYIFLFFTFMGLSISAQKTLQERLGYPKTAKLLIIHADDLGMAHAQNSGSILAMEKGSVNSASLMVPCPWFSEIAAYAKDHPYGDFGIHLTLNSEWKYYKWRPVLGTEDGRTLIDESGFLHENLEIIDRNANAAEVENELRAQIDLALSKGVDVTHLDTHMGALFLNPDLFQVYKRLGKKYKLPVLLSKAALENYGLSPDLLEESDLVLDRVFTAEPKDYQSGLATYYTKVLQKLQPGVHAILLHTAHLTDELESATIEHEDYGAKWRQQDLDFFTSEKCKNLLKENNIQLLTWREIRDKLVR